MIPELGHFALILALVVAATSGVLSLIGAHQNRSQWIALAIPGGRLLAALITFSFCCLTYAFINNDFSVTYVVEHSNSLLPMQYRIAGVWGGHEGSLLLWLSLIHI